MMGTCECGNELPELPERFAALIGTRPRWCGACIERMDAEEAQQEAQRASERDTFERRRRLAAVGAPDHLAGWRFGSIDRMEGLESAVSLARRWASGEVSGAGLRGPVGTGKTRVAVAAAHEMARRRPCRWYSAPLLLARLGSGGFNSPERVAALEALTGTCALVLDDVDKARPSEYAAEALFLAVDSRTDGSAPLLVTTNLNGAELSARWPQPYGEAIASRLGLLSWVRVQAPDKRAAPAAGRRAAS